MCQWHPFDPQDPSDQLQDHYYYLVAHADFKTPMKAKWHDDVGGQWEIFVGCGQPNEYLYAWDEPYKVTAWMELPDLP